MEQDENHYTDYAKGINDCLAGKSHQAGNSPRYDKGYQNQFNLEQVISHG